MSKGSARRPTKVSKEQLNNNWELAFGNKEVEIENKTTEPRMYTLKLRCMHPNHVNRFPTYITHKVSSHWRCDRNVVSLGKDPFYHYGRFVDTISYEDGTRIFASALISMEQVVKYDETLARIQRIELIRNVTYADKVYALEPITLPQYTPLKLSKLELEGAYATLYLNIFLTELDLYGIDSTGWKLEKNLLVKDID